ncbi:hypothetical protein D3C86_1868850 [compost metagenome]
MTSQQIEMLNALEAYAQRAFAKGGQYATHRSGTFQFEGQEVYFRKGSDPAVVMLKVYGEEFDCVLWGN